MNKLVYLIIALSFASIHAQAHNPRQMNTSTDIELPVGKSIKFKLPSNRTTGYVWQLKNELSNTSPVVITDDGYIQTKPQRIGSGGYQYWTIKAQNANTITLTFEKLRPWEKDIKPVETKTITITVKN